jgi:hypothetical protein
MTIPAASIWPGIWRPVANRTKPSKAGWPSTRRSNGITNEIIAARRDLGDGLVRVVTFGRTVDMTALLASLYRLGYRVAIIDGESFHQHFGRRVRQLSFGCAPRAHLNLVAALKEARIAVSGYRRKATVALADEERAIEVVRKMTSDSHETELHSEKQRSHDPDHARPVERSPTQP